MTKSMLSCLALTSLLLAGCAESPYGQKQTLGGLSGAALGGLLGAFAREGRGRSALARSRAS